MPILVSLNPNCERFSFRVFWIRCAVTVNFTLLALNLRWVARVILFHLRFLFIRLPSSRRCGLAETVGLCFRVDSDRVTLGFVLGLVCVCLFVLFCSVVVVLFVVGWQQHRRYIVIDAMVYPKNWILEDEVSTGKTSGVFGLNMVFLHLVLRWKKILNLEVTTLCMSRPRWVLDDASSSIFVALEDEPSLAAFRLSLTIFWSWMWSGIMNIFLRIVSVHGSDVIGWDVMSKGGMEIWRPMGTPFV